MGAPRVSIVMPFHDAAATLHAAAASMLAQSLADFEFILVDDGSRDGSFEIAEKLARRDARVRLLQPGRVGIVEALRVGCGAARARYIARMDADDEARPDRLARQWELMEATPSAGICGALVELAGPASGIGARRYEAWINALVTPEDLAREVYIECPLPHPTFFMRRDAYEDVGGYQDRGWPEDYDLVLRMHLAGWELAKVPGTLLCWRDHPGRLSRTDPRYGEAAFRACKRAYLRRGPLHGRTTFHQWGAGEVGKRWMREWGADAPAAVVDINPRKVGRRIHGVPVIGPESLPPPGATYTVVAVGAPGARAEIRDWFSSRGYAETRDYVFVA
jgi:glycosyltransferase involved in cell wall biosynthesis